MLFEPDKAGGNRYYSLSNNLYKGTEHNWFGNVLVITRLMRMKVF